MQTIISNHNRKVLVKKPEITQTGCNCQNIPTCPTPGECLRNNVIYHATVKHEDGKSAEYIGSTETEFKLRYNNHNKSFKHKKYKSETTLSKYVWDNNLNPKPNIKWKFLKKCTTYDVGKKSCDLCTSEKFLIIKNLHRINLINKRTDIGNSCPHKRKKTFKQ